ncbi:uncharacterized protein DS421_20g690080 [Arachis hypogaea]|nr:uncharacterized protein DS421_20g690080 [Arachis hypogaea]
MTFVSNIGLQSTHVSFGRIHPPKLNWTSQSHFISQMNRQMNHYVEERRRKDPL